MGMIANIYRTRDPGRLSVYEAVREVTLVNVPGPFEPNDEAPAAELVEGPMPGTLVVRPCDGRQYAMGGDYVASVDSRFSEAAEAILGRRFYGAVALHDWQIDKEGRFP